MTENLLRTYVTSGGPLMWVLIPCSVLVVGAVVQASIRLRRGRVVPPGLARDADAVADPEGARNLARALRADRSPFARAATLALEKLSAPPGDAPGPAAPGGAVDEACAYVADDLYEELGVFSTLYTVAPLLGLLGTILGMIGAFQSFGSQEAEDLLALSSGIQQALVTTLWGLGIAIPAYLGAHGFQTRIRLYEREILPPEVRRVVGILLSFGAAAPAPVSATPAPSSSPPDGSPSDESASEA